MKEYDKAGIIPKNRPEGRAPECVRFAGWNFCKLRTVSNCCGIARVKPRRSGENAKETSGLIWCPTTVHIFHFFLHLLQHQVKALRQTVYAGCSRILLLYGNVHCSSQVYHVPSLHSSRQLSIDRVKRQGTFISTPKRVATLVSAVWKNPQYSSLFQDSFGQYCCLVHEYVTLLSFTNFMCESPENTTSQNFQDLTWNYMGTCQVLHSIKLSLQLWNIIRTRLYELCIMMTTQC